MLSNLLARVRPITGRIVRNRDGEGDREERRSTNEIKSNGIGRSSRIPRDRLSEANYSAAATKEFNVFPPALSIACVS